MNAGREKVQIENIGPFKKHLAAQVYYHGTVSDALLIWIHTARLICHELLISHKFTDDAMDCSSCKKVFPIMTCVK